MISVRHYIAKADPDKPLTAQHFGYWSLRWSYDSAQYSMTKLQEEPYGAIAGVKTSLTRAYELKLFLIALHAGAYWAFAAAIPTLFRNLQTEDFTQTLADLKAGCEDATRELLKWSDCFNRSCSVCLRIDWKFLPRPPGRHRR